MKVVAAVAAAIMAMLGVLEPEDWGHGRDSWADSPEYETSRAVCRAVSDRQPPPRDRPSASEIQALNGCSSEALYYGIGRPADPDAARKCAFIEEPDDQPIQPFSGRAMLMVIYANGVGAERDLDVAIHLACGLDGAPAEAHGRIMHLVERRDSGRRDRDFHYCDDITSGLAGGYCAGHEAAIAGQRRAAELERLTSGWTAAERRAMERLREAHQAYADAHGAGEVEQTGTLRVALTINAEEYLHELFLDNLRLLARGRAPQSDRAQFAAADRALNSAYRERIRDEFFDEPGAVTREGIRNAQRAWIQYRDAFVAFAAIKFPGTSRDSLAAWLTRQRTEMLGREQF